MKEHPTELLLFVHKGRETNKLFVSKHQTKMYICMSVRSRGKRDFLAPNIDRGLISSSFTTYGCRHPCYNFY